MSENKVRSFSTRPVQENDRGDLIALLGKNYFGVDTISDPEDLALASSRADSQIRGTLDETSGKKLFLAVADNKTVALAYVIPDAVRGGYIVDDLYTRKEYEGKGIASALLDECANFVKQRGDKDIHLSVVASNAPLVNFYSKRGWLKQTFTSAYNNDIEQSKTDIDPRNERVATHLMKKEL